MVRTIGYHWHLRRLMADRDMFATTELGPLLAERGVVLSREQVYRLVTGVPERLSLATLAALCDILGCGPGDLVEPSPVPARRPGRAGPDAAASGPVPRPVRARVTARPAGSGRGSPLPGRARAGLAAARPAVPPLPPGQVIAAVSAARPVTARGGDRGRGGRGRPGRAALRHLADALAADPAALAAGAPPVAGRLAAELSGPRFSRPTVPACAVCGRSGKPLFRGDGGGVCQRCRAWQLARPCAACGKVRPVARDRRARPAGLRGLPPPG